MEDTTLKKRNCRLVHGTFCEVFIVLVWLITGQKYKDMIMQYFIVSWWKIVIFYLGCLKCFTWDGQQSETAVFWGPARPKKAPQIWWKTQESYFFSLFLGMCEHAFSVSFYLCGKVETCSFLKMLLSNFWLGWDFSQVLLVTCTWQGLVWSATALEAPSKMCFIWLHTGWANSNPVMFDQPVAWQKV